jgi:tyrosyl-tRNA synthetase
MATPNYIPNTAQARLAEEVTRIVHGEQGLQTALAVTKGVTPGSDTALDAATLEMLAQDMPSKTIQRQEVVNSKLVDLLVISGLQPSKGQARRLIENGGAYVNNNKVDNVDFTVAEEVLIDGHLLLLSVGKKNKLLIRISP